VQFYILLSKILMIGVSFFFGSNIILSFSIISYIYNSLEVLKLWVDGSSEIER